MAKRKDKSKVVATLRLPSSRKPYYYQVILWDSIKSLRDYFEVNDDTLAMTCFEPWYVDDDTGAVYINPKLGEIHFARDHWNVNVVAHEVMHAVIHRMRLVWPPAHLIMLDEYADAEEEVAYELGNWTERVHHWLWQQDPGGATNPTPYHRATFPLPRYLSTVRYPKSGLRLSTKRRKPDET
jgi:hypothetical protein